MLHEGYEFKKKLRVKKNEVVVDEAMPEFDEPDAENPIIEDENTYEQSTINVQNHDAKILAQQIVEERKGNDHQLS